MGGKEEVEERGVKEVRGEEETRIGGAAGLRKGKAGCRKEK